LKKKKKSKKRGKGRGGGEAVVFDLSSARTSVLPPASVVEGGGKGVEAVLLLGEPVRRKLSLSLACGKKGRKRENAFLSPFITFYGKGKCGGEGEKREGTGAVISLFLRYS